MSKAETSYSERERLIKLQSLASFGINPMAAMIVFEAYAEHVHPLPIKYVWHTGTKDKIMDPRAVSKSTVEIYISTAGYLGNRKGDPTKCDELALKLLAMSYYRDLRPMPVTFQMANAVEFSIRTPGVSDFDPKNKNPFRTIKI